VQNCPSQDRNLDVGKICGLHHGSGFSVRWRCWPASRQHGQRMIVVNGAASTKGIERLTYKKGDEPRDTDIRKRNEILRIVQFSS
jgi:hypothetical protein